MRVLQSGGRGRRWQWATSATITIKGQDQASAAINKAGASAKGLSNSLDAAQKKAQGLGGSMRSIASGDVVGGISGLASSLGGGGLAGSAALASAAIAGVVGAAGLAVVATARWAFEVEQLRAKLAFAFVGGEKQAFAIADAIGGVSVEAVAKLGASLKAMNIDSNISVSQMRQLTAAAAAVGKTGDEALSAFADAIRTQSTEVLSSVGIMIRGKSEISKYAKALGVTVDALTPAERAQVVMNAALNALPSAAQGGTKALTSLDEKISKLDNNLLQLKLNTSNMLAEPAANAVGFGNTLAVLAGKIDDVIQPLGQLADVSSSERVEPECLVIRKDWRHRAYAAGAGVVAFGGVAAGVASKVAEGFNKRPQRKKAAQAAAIATRQG
jgi:hypothetical protein